jgi:hypothetical protein
VRIFSIPVPEAAPLLISLDELACSASHLKLFRTSLRHRAASDHGGFDEPIPHLFVAASKGILAFDLLLAFGSASSMCPSANGTLITLPGISTIDWRCLEASSDGSLLACAHSAGTTVLTLPELSVRTSHLCLHAHPSASSERNRARICTGGPYSPSRCYGAGHPNVPARQQ